MHYVWENNWIEDESHEMMKDEVIYRGKMTTAVSLSIYFMDLTAHFAQIVLICSSGVFEVMGVNVALD